MIFLSNYQYVYMVCHTIDFMVTGETAVSLKFYGILCSMNGRLDLVLGEWFIERLRRR